MQAPPTYTPPPAAPPQKPRTALWVGLAVGGCCICFTPILAAIVLPVFVQSNWASKHKACLSNVKQLALGQLIYSADWDDRFPPAEEWMDALKSSKSAKVNPAVFQCPLVKDGHGYAMSDAVAKKPQTAIAKPETTILLFETSDLGYNAHGDPKKVMEIPRHERQTVAFANGAAKMLRSPSGKTTFAE
ncbi:MAG: hypothetical protein ACO1SV_09505 [Fimbriimonas sp.]